MMGGMASATTPFQRERRILDRDLLHSLEVTHGLDPDAEQWHALRQLTTDLVTLDLLCFFNANPYACVTLGDVALCIGRSAGQVRPFLSRLVDAQVLNAIPVLDLLVYQLADGEELRRQVQHFVIWFGESFNWGRGLLRRPPAL